jgi:hypothetical protein
MVKVEERSKIRAEKNRKAVKNYAGKEAGKGWRESRCGAQRQKRQNGVER